MTSRVIPVDPFTLVVFGGSGDLSRRKILPALFLEDVLLSTCSTGEDRSLLLSQTELTWPDLT